MVNMPIMNLVRLFMTFCTCMHKVYVTWIFPDTIRAPTIDVFVNNIIWTADCIIFVVHISIY